MKKLLTGIIASIILTTGIFAVMNKEITCDASQYGFDASHSCEYIGGFSKAVYNEQGERIAFVNGQNEIVK